MKIENENVSGFFTVDDNIKIFDVNGNLFYIFKKNKDNEKTKFNLPAGVFYTENNLIKLPKKIKYKKIELPKPQVLKKMPEKFKIIYSANPNKCTVFIDKGLIVFDNFFKTVFPFVRYFILLHELGHYFYKTEKFCDLFAAKNMLERGYNPSQIYFASKFTLSKNAEHRKKYTFEKIKNV